MGVISCPNCQGKLRVPDDGVTRKVKCPSCQQVFSSKGGPDSQGPRSSAPTRKPTPEFEVIDEDDDRPAKSSKRKDGDLGSILDSAGRSSRDDDDDRPRRRRREEEDDEDDRPRSRRRDEEEDYNDDDRGSRRPRGRGRARTGPSRTNWDVARKGLALAALAPWCMIGCIGALMLMLLLGWAGVMEPSLYKLLSILGGLAGLAYWVLTVTGVCYFFAMGPTRGPAFGLGIATACVAIIHAMLLLMEMSGQMGGFRELAFLLRGSGANLMITHTQLPLLSLVIAGVLQSGQFPDAVPLIVMLLELAQVVLLMLFIKAAASEKRDYEAAKTANAAMIVVPGSVGVLAIVILIASSVLDGPRSGNLGMMLFLLVLGGFIGLFVFMALAMKSGVDALNYR